MMGLIMPVVPRHTRPLPLARAIEVRAEAALRDDEETVVLDLEDHDARDVVRCAALRYAARYLRSIHAHGGADLLEHRIDQLQGPGDTVIVLVDNDNDKH